MYELKKNGKVFTSNLLGPGHRLMKKRIYRAVVSQRLRNTGVNFMHLFLGCYFRTDGPTGKHEKAVWRIFKGFFLYLLLPQN